MKIYVSRAKGNNREGSDIDVVITNDKEYSELHSIINEIEESIIPYLLELSAYSKLNPESLKEHINRVGKYFIKNYNPIFWKRQLY